MSLPFFRYLWHKDRWLPCTGRIYHKRWHQQYNRFFLCLPTYHRVFMSISDLECSSLILRRVGGRWPTKVRRLSQRRSSRPNCQCSPLSFRDRNGAVQVTPWIMNVRMKQRYWKDHCYQHNPTMFLRQRLSVHILEELDDYHNIPVLRMFGIIKVFYNFREIVRVWTTPVRGGVTLTSSSVSVAISGGP